MLAHRELEYGLQRSVEQVLALNIRILKLDVVNEVATFIFRTRRNGTPRLKLAFMSLMF